MSSWSKKLLTAKDAKEVAKDAKKFRTKTGHIRPLVVPSILPPICGILAPTRCDWKFYEVTPWRSAIHVERVSLPEPGSVTSAGRQYWLRRRPKRAYGRLGRQRRQLRREQFRWRLPIPQQP